MSVQIPNIFYEDPSNGIRAFPCGQTDRRSGRQTRRG